MLSRKPNIEDIVAKVGNRGKSIEIGIKNDKSKPGTANQVTNTNMKY